MSSLFKLFNLGVAGAGLAEMLKCQCNVDVEYGNLQTRIKKIDSLIQVLGNKFKAECRMEA